MSISDAQPQPSRWQRALPPIVAIVVGLNVLGVTVAALFRRSALSITPIEVLGTLIPVYVILTALLVVKHTKFEASIWLRQIVLVVGALVVTGAAGLAIS